MTNISTPPQAGGCIDAAHTEDDGEAPTIVRKATCIVVRMGNEVLGSFVGPDAERNAETFRAALVAPAHFDGYLCRAWGETELPCAEVVRDMAGVRHFIVREWLGDENDPDLPGIMGEVEADIEREKAWFAQFEIGGASVEPVYSVGPAAPGAAAAAPIIVWPKSRDVGRIGDMSPDDALRVGFDSDNDVYLCIMGGNSVEFCTPGAGGGASSRTREALIALMVAIEADNAERPTRDWWARRNGAQQGAKA